MLYRVLAIGDVVGENGLAMLSRHLRTVKNQFDVRFTVVNAENISGLGLTPKQADAVFAAGADVITLGNHTFNRMQIAKYLEECPYILRPANFTGRSPGRGCGVYDGGDGLRIAVINLIGRCELWFNADNPFTTADRLLRENSADLTLVDFHAEATSEKLAMAWYLDGRVSALWGTHTHVATADEQVLPKGTGYQTDLGMTGPIHSVLGILPEQSIENYLGGLPGRYQVAEGPCKICGTVFTIDTGTGLCTGAERIEIR